MNQREKKADHRRIKVPEKDKPLAEAFELPALSKKLKVNFPQENNEYA